MAKKQNFIVGSTNPNTNTWTSSQLNNGWNKYQVLKSGDLDGVFNAVSDYSNDSSQEIWNAIRILKGSNPTGSSTSELGNIISTVLGAKATKATDFITPLTSSNKGATESDLNTLREEIETSSLTFKGYVATSAPSASTYGLVKGNIWINASEMPTTFPVAIAGVWNGTSWESTTDTYTVQDFDFFRNINDNEGYYWFGGQWVVMSTDMSTTYFSLNQTSGKWEIKSSVNLPGSPTTTTPAAGNSSTRIATTAFVANNFAPLASPEFTGTPTAPTPTSGSTDNQIATKKYVDEAIAPLPTTTYFPDLFDVKWADHICDDMSWLRADTFSWQSKSAYTVAYNHLADDINGKSLTSETVSGVTVQFYLADDGHKICPASEESNVASIYTATGVAWYYIIDTVNERFKLPRVNPDKELLMQTSPVVGNGQTIAFNAPQNGVNLYDKELIVNRYDYGGNIHVQRTMLIDQNIPNTTTASALTWSRSGLVADLTSATGIYEGKKYLYFYVGNFTQTAIENTAGLNASLFNGKADTDLSNLTSTGKEKLGSKVYVASGMLFNSSGDTCEGYGTVTVSLYPNGIARIDFNIKFTTSGTSSSNFTCGLNRDLISYINSNIPQITPTTGGSLTYYSTSGSIDDSKMGYGGIMVATGQFWQPGRVYNTSGSIGGFPAAEYVANQRIIGVCYGKYSV